MTSLLVAILLTALWIWVAVCLVCFLVYAFRGKLVPYPVSFTMIAVSVFLGFRLARSIWLIS